MASGIQSSMHAELRLPIAMPCVPRIVGVLSIDTDGPSSHGCMTMRTSIGGIMFWVLIDDLPAHQHSKSADSKLGNRVLFTENGGLRYHPLTATQQQQRLGCSDSHTLNSVTARSRRQPASLPEQSRGRALQRRECRRP